MTNLDELTDHNIFGCLLKTIFSHSAVDLPLARRNEGGYTLVALLALMTILALFAMAVAPSIQQQAQREQEKEAIFRGEQVADAIRAYYLNRFQTLRLQGDQALPTNIDQLLEGIPIQGAAKNRQILRASAARDPLSPDGEWRYIHPRSQALIDFQRAILVYAGNVVPTPRHPQMASLQQLAVPMITNVLNTGIDDKSGSSSSVDDDSSGPFVGVSPRKSKSSVLTYYGIDELDQWIFTPLFRP